MIIFSDKKTGEILMRIDGFSHDQAAMGISVEPKPGQVIEKKIVKPESQSAKLAKEMENPRVPTSNKDYQVINNNLSKK